ncbi:MAG: GNAT family N-acetyltransferase [Specibacter sp.]
MLKPETAQSSLDVLESLMDAAWPALESSTADGWKLRSAGGVTQRANSIWPVSEGSGSAASLRAAEDWYAERRQPVIFQLTHKPENAALESFLDTRGYSRQSETIIMAATPVPAVAVSQIPGSAGVRVDVADAPAQEWLDLWWAVDGRGGAAEKELAGRILAGVPSLYAAARNDTGEVVGTGRLTIVDGWAGVYAMATHPDFRRRGVAGAVLSELLRQASAANAERLWLMATAANTGAQALYSASGFTEVGRYHYRQAPLRRSLGAC